MIITILLYLLGAALMTAYILNDQEYYAEAHEKVGPIFQGFIKNELWTLAVVSIALWPLALVVFFFAWKQVKAEKATKK